MTAWLRYLAFCLGLLVAACVSIPTQTDSPTPASTFTPSPSPTSTASPTGLPTSTPTANLTPTPTPTPTPTATPSTDVGTLSARLQGTLDQLLDQQRTSLGIPGMTAAIIFPDGSTWSAASGQAQVSQARSATLATPFVVGSITKTFVAATIMQLADEGQLSLGDPLSKWLPDYPEADQITLRLLLSHTSGVFNLYESPDYSDLVVRHPHRTWTPQDVLDNLVEAPYCDPGTCYHYSNTGFILLGMVIEEQTGQSFGAVLRERFLGPLGLDATFFQGDGPPPDGAALGYLPSRNGNVVIDDGTTYRPTQSEGTVIWAAGGIVASVRDVARWAQALYGGVVVSTDSLARMTDYKPYKNGDYGLGTRSRIYAGHRMFGHTGALRGFNAAMWYMPDLDITVAVLANRTKIDANAISDALLSLAVAAVE